MGAGASVGMIRKKKSRGTKGWTPVMVLSVQPDPEEDEVKTLNLPPVGNSKCTHTMDLPGVPEGLEDWAKQRPSLLHFQKHPKALPGGC